MRNSIKSNQLKTAIMNGLNKGWHGYIWMMKIIVPISFLTALLAWSGWIERLDFLIQPVMNILNLPSIAALPLIIGTLTGIYGGVAAMAVLPLSLEQMTLIAIFLLIAHNLVQEGAIQGKSGVHPVKATLFRLIVATVTVLIVSWFFDMTVTIRAITDEVPPQSLSFVIMLKDWGITTLNLIIRIFFIIMFILTMLEILKSFGWINHIVRFLSPLLKAMGLSRRVGILWMTAVIFGLAYGGAVIIEETKNEQLTKEELEELHLSIGINHAMIEDPSLFLPLGISPFWLWVPRLLVAVIAVRFLTMWQFLKKKGRS
ncbi:MAG: iron transporter [Deltaproteobacteria bacterium]|nr:iron transporter [Deltaproteobacteria bacterium]